jgi:hypothetical protein
VDCLVKTWDQLRRVQVDCTRDVVFVVPAVTAMTRMPTMTTTMTTTVMGAMATVTDDDDVSVFLVSPVATASAASLSSLGLLSQAKLKLETSFRPVHEAFVAGSWLKRVALEDSPQGQSIPR